MPELALEREFSLGALAPELNGQELVRSDGLLKGLPLFSGAGAKSVKIAYVKKEGKMAIVGFQTQPEGYAEPVVLDLKLRERDGYWQLMELSNYTAYQKKIDELETKRVAKLNESVIKEMRKSLVFKDGCTKTTRQDDWGIKKEYDLQFEYSNKGKKEIDRYEAVIRIFDGEGNLLKELEVQDNNGLKPGTNTQVTWTFEANPFIKEDVQVFASQDIQVQIEPSYLKFKDGTELKLHQKFE
jgi:hypothetical protein